jgi:hypothetical protein
MEPTMFGLEDGERTQLHKCGLSTALIRPSEAITGRTMLWKSNPMEVQAMLELLVESTLDGGNFGDMTDNSL